MKNKVILTVTGIFLLITSLGQAAPEPSSIESKLVGVKWITGIGRSGRYGVDIYNSDHTGVWIKTSVNPKAGLRFRWHLEGNKLVYTNFEGGELPSKTIIEITHDTLTLKEGEYTIKMHRLTQADLKATGEQE